MFKKGLSMLLALTMMFTVSATALAAEASQPTVTEPTQVQSAELQQGTQPAETQPAETQPTQTQPVETQPAEAQPTETQPGETQPAATQPAETQPAETQPANQAEVKGYLVLGQDLSAEQQATVLALMGITDLSGYSVSYTTHQEEVDAFGNYLSASVLGSKALSSILLIPGEEGSGITITTYNINYCTQEMYQNALIDVGVKDVQVIVCGPVSLSGTCALVSAMKAYSIMTGQPISQEAQDTAVNEIVTTGTVADAVGDADLAAQIIAALKQNVLNEDLNEDGISSALDELCNDLGVQLDETTRQEIISLMLKLKNADIDVNALKEQASNIYNQIKEQFGHLNISIDGEDVGTLGYWMDRILNAIVNFFKNLFG